MTEKELKKMSRTGLIEIIALQKKRELEPIEQLKNMERQLVEREIKINMAGSIAEAALALNGVFEAAQKAADDYLLSVKAMADKEEQTSETEIVTENEEITEDNSELKERIIIG